MTGGEPATNQSGPDEPKATEFCCNKIIYIYIFLMSALYTLAT
jgi:hypothetical protein